MNGAISHPSSAILTALSRRRQQRHHAGGCGSGGAAGGAGVDLEKREREAIMEGRVRRGSSATQ